MGKQVQLVIPSNSSFSREAKMTLEKGYAHELGNTMPEPGFYKANRSLIIQEGNLILDAEGDTDAVWIFQTDHDLITQAGAGGHVILCGGCKPNNVFWQIGGLVSIGAETSFKGNLIELAN